MNRNLSKASVLLPFLLLIIFSLPFRFYNYTYPLLDAFNFRQAQTATIALNFYTNGINFFQTELDIFGTGKERFLTLEFPLYEVIVSLFYKVFLFNDIWGRVVSILSGYVGAWYVYKLTLLFLKERKIAFFASFFFLFTPLSMFYQRTFMIDPFIITILLIGFYHSTKWICFNNSRDYIIGMLFLTIGFIHKGLYGPFWLLPIVMIYLKNHHSKTSRSKFLLLTLLPLGILFLWQQHVNSINMLAGHGFFTTDSTSHREWNFGTLSERLDIQAWGFRLRQLFEGVFLKPGLALFLLGLASLKKYKYSVIFLSWIFSACVYFVVLFHIQMQNYYQLILVPIFSIPMAIGTVRILNWGTQKLLPIGKQFTVFIIISAVFCSIYAWKSWMNIFPSYFVDWSWNDRLLSISRVTKSSQKGIFLSAGYDWNSVYTYIPKRKMLLVSVEDLDGESVFQWKKEGYSFLVLHSQDSYESYIKNFNRVYDPDLFSGLKKLSNNQEFTVYQL